MKRQHLVWGLLLVLAGTLDGFAWSGRAGAGETPMVQRLEVADIPIYDAQALGYQPVSIPPVPDSAIRNPNSAIEAHPVPGSALEDSAIRNPNSAIGTPYASLVQSGPTVLGPGAVGRYTLTLANTESVTRTVWLEDQLPAELALVPGSAPELAYDAETRTLSWQGQLAPGHLDYAVDDISGTLPYLDLADFGAPHLCQPFFDEELPCDEAAVTLNLGASGYRYQLYGQSYSQITLTPDGLALAGAGADETLKSANVWLPTADLPGPILAGLWREADLTAGGRWHAGIVTGLLADHDLFYAQWQAAPLAADPDVTASQAIALVLDGPDATPPGPQSGHIFFLYAGLSDPAAQVAQGYTIGLADKLGARGVTWAFAPAPGDPTPPQGWPPAAGATLHFWPVLRGADRPYTRTFSFAVTVNASVPATVANTARLTTDSPDPALAQVWATHILPVRWPHYLPLLLLPPGSQEATP